MMLMNLQFFAENPAPAPAPQTSPTAPTTPQQPPSPATAPQPDAGSFEKLLELVQGKQRVSEESVLKGYFKQQGLSGEEMTQAIKAFKEQKAAAELDAEALAKERDDLRAALQNQMIENAATLEAMSLGISEATIPYVTKLADFGEVVGEDGKLKDGAIKTAIEAVLTAVPALKPSQEQGLGFRVGGSGTGNEGSGTPTSGTPNQNVTQKRWNRFR